ncbi:hypothetical protein DMENIID0001_077740 [Sergentomyia squamirostris]
MKSLITWCLILAFLWTSILAEKEENVDREQKKRQTLSDSLLHHHPVVATSAALVETPAATVAPVLHVAPTIHAPPTPLPLTRAYINHGPIVPIARPLAIPYPAATTIPYPLTFPIHKPAIPIQIASYPAYAPAPFYLPQVHHYPTLATTASTSALKVIPAPNLAPFAHSFAPVYRYNVAPFGFGYHPSYKYF